jgi:GGDEF domain-containing protein
MLRNDDLIESLIGQEPLLTRLFAAAAVLGLVVIGVWEWLLAEALPQVLAVALTAGLAATYAGLLVVLAVSAVWRLGRSKDSLLLEAQEEAQSGKRLAIYDRATGLFHSWYFELRLNEEVERCQRYGSSMAVLAISIEPRDKEEYRRNWKELNSSLGQLVASTVRTVDISASFGHLEYAVCLPQCDGEGARAAATRLVNALGEHSANIGVGLYPEDGTNGKTLLEHARQRPHREWASIGDAGSPGATGARGHEEVDDLSPEALAAAVIKRLNLSSAAKDGATHDDPGAPDGPALS